jgi:hypothetical protein
VTTNETPTTNPEPTKPSSGWEGFFGPPSSNSPAGLGLLVLCHALNPDGPISREVALKAGEKIAPAFVRNRLRAGQRRSRRS